MVDLIALRVLPFALLSLISRASGERLLPRDANSSSSVTAAPSCEASCVALDAITTWHWNRVTITETLTAATIIYIVDDATNKTRISTKTNTLPAGVTVPPTNAKGTHVSDIPVETAPGKTTTVQIAYPTEFMAYPLSYYWYGTLPTSDSEGNPVCSTVANTDRQYVTFSPYKTPEQEKPTSTDTADPAGFTYALLPEVCWWLPSSTINPNDAAPTLCRTQALCPEAVVSTVAFLTATSVSHESSTPDPTPEPGPSTSKEPVTPQPITQPSQPGQASQTAAPAPAPAPSASASQPVNPGGGGNNGGTSGGNNAGSGSQGGGQQASAPATALAQPATPSPIVIGSQTASFDSSSNLVIGSQTVSQGSQITVSGNTVSLASGATAAVINGATLSIAPAASPAPAVISVGSTLVTANSNGAFVISTSGSASTIALTTNAGGQTIAVLGGKTETVSTLPKSSGGIGGAVASGIELSNDGGSSYRGGCGTASLFILPLLLATFM